MQIIKVNKELENKFYDINKYLKENYKKETGFHSLLIGPDRMQIPKTTIEVNTIDSIKKMGLSNFENNDNNFRYFVRAVDIFTKINSVSTKEYSSEIISEFFSINEINIVLYIESLFYSEKLLNFKDILISENFSFLLFNKMKEEKKEKKLDVWFKEEMFLFSGKVDIGSKTITDYKYLNQTLKRVVSFYENHNKDSEDKEFSFKFYETLDSQEKKEWLEAYNTQIEVYNYDVIKQASKLSEALGISNIYLPETNLIDKMNNKYATLLNSLEIENSNCRILKSIIYLGIFLIRKNAQSFEPVKKMNELIGADVSWAVGTEKTKEASFYGDSEIGKLFYGYAPFMTAKENPYSEIINNKTLDEMDKVTIDMQDYFRNFGLEKIVYELLFEKEVAGGKSIYDLLGSVKELVEIIESPILVSSVLNDALSMFKGIISSMINTALTSLDFTLTQAMKELFYLKFIPFSGKKHSLREIHDYCIFLKLILEQVDGNNTIELVEKEVFVKNAYIAIGFSEDDVKKIGYFAFSREENQKINYIAKGLERDNNNIEITCDVHFKLFYSFIQFAKQKRNKRYGFRNNDNHSSTSEMSSLIKTLTTEEKFWIMSRYNLDFEKINDSFGSVKLENYLEFNETIFNIRSIYNHSEGNFAFIESYEEYDKTKIILEMSNAKFSEVNLNRIITGFLKNYKQIVGNNKTAIEESIFEENGVSNIDDFLMRYLPTFVELSKTLGYSDGTINSIIKLLDTVCNFITNVLFKEYFFKIKIEINEKLKSYSDDMFKKISSITDKYNFDDIILNFDIGGSTLVKNIDGVMKAMEEGVEKLSELRLCFHDEDFIVSKKKNDEEEDSYGYVDFLERNDDITVTYVRLDQVKKEENSHDQKTNEQINKEVLEKINTSSNTKVDGNGEINYIYKEKITINSEVKDNEKVEVTKNKIDDIIKIKDKIDSLTNVEYVENMNKLIITEKRLTEELKKVKPSQSLIKELKKEIEGYNNRLIQIKPGIKQNINIIEEKTGSIDYAYVEDFFSTEEITGEYDFDRVDSLLDNIQEVVFENNLPLTNHEIIKLLK